MFDQRGHPEQKLPRDIDGQLIREGHQCICLCNTLMNI